MLEAIIRGRRRRSITTINPFSSSALIAFEPRQVTLAKHQQQQQLKMKNKKMSSETLEVDSQGKIVVEKSTQKSKKKKKSKDSSPLLHSLAIFLENKGFAKTLSAFKSEASIEELDGLKEHTLDLEEMYAKYLETSKYNGKTDSDGSKKLDSQKEEVAEEDKGTKCDAMESISKVKRKERNENDGDVVNVQHGVSNGFTKEKKKKSKLVPDSSGENTREVGSEAAQGPADTMVFKAQLEELDKKPKDKKKKKNKRTSETLTENVEQCAPEALLEVSIEKTSAEEKNVKSKDKKRKKSKSTSEDDVEKPEREDSEKPDSSKEEKSSKKRKRSGAEENESQTDQKIVTKESKQSNNKGSEKKGVGEDQIPKTDVLQDGDGHAGKKRKTEHGQEEADQQDNGSLLNNGKQGSARKQPNGSAEPKTVNAFKRVDVEKVEFINEKLQDNSYWAKDGADSGYGAKAQEVLGQVRGRDFRHEKTKKKRGSYRGGQIDLQSHSFKFDNSDDE